MNRELATQIQSEYEESKQTDTKGIIESEISNKMEFGTLTLTKELKEAAFKAVMSRYNAVKKQRQQRIKEYDDLETLYKAGASGINSGSASGQQTTLSEVMTTDGYNSVEDWVSLLIDAMFPVDPPFDIKGRKRTIMKDQINYIKQVLNQNMDRTDYQMEFEQVSRQGVKLGTFVGKSMMMVDEEPAIRVVEKDKIIGGMTLKDEQGNTIKEKGMETYIDIEDYIGYKFVDLRRLFFRQDKLTWIIEKIDSCWSEIEYQAKKGLYDNLEDAKKTCFPGEQQDKELQKIDKIDEVNNENIHTIDNDVQLLEAHHIPLELEGKLVNCLIVIANEAEVIRVQPDPYVKLPYLFTKFMDKSGVEGMGLMEILKKMLIEINTRRKMSLDANSMGLYGMKAVHMQYIKYKEQLKIRKDGLIELKNTDKPIDQIIQFFRPPTEYAQLATQLIDKISIDIVRTTRMKGILSGEKVTPQPSASEWAGMMKEALKSVKVILKRVAKGQIEEWLERAYIMNVMNRQKSWQVPIKQKIQTQEGERTIEKIVEEWIEISPQDIYSDGVDIKVIGIQYMEDQVVMRHQQMQLLEVLYRAMGVPLYNDAGQQVEPDLYKELSSLLIYFGKDSPEESFRLKILPPQMPQESLGMPNEGGMPVNLPKAPQGSNPANMADILKASIGGSI